MTSTFSNVNALFIAFLICNAVNQHTGAQLSSLYTKTISYFINETISRKFLISTCVAILTFDDKGII